MIVNSKKTATQSLLVSKDILSTAKLSLAVSVFVLGLKLWAYFLTHSAVILSDAIESVVNVLSAIVAVFVIYYSQQPADRDHPYGYGKLEYFSSAFEGGMIFFASLMIVYESVRSFTHGVKIEHIGLGLTFSALATFFNFVMGLYLLRKARLNNSEALKASGIHLLGDCWTTLGAALALGIVAYTGMAWLDPAIAVVFALVLAWSGLKIFKKSTNLLIDGFDREGLENLVVALNVNRREGVIDIHHLRSIKSGNFHHIDAHMVVPEFWDVKKVHELSHEFEQNVVAQYKYSGEFAFHLDPCKQSYCNVCSVQTCTIRREDFIQERKFEVDRVIGDPEPTLVKKEVNV